MNAKAVSVVVVALVIGFAVGTLFFPRASTSYTTVTRTLATTYTASSSGQVITLTAVVVGEYFYQGTCTVVSGVPTVTYNWFAGDWLTTVVTVYNGTLPAQYSATVTTDYGSTSISNVYQPYPETC